MNTLSNSSKLCCTSTGPLTKLCGISTGLLTMLLMVIALLAMEWADINIVLIFWLFVLLSLTMFTIACGQCVTGRWLGALIDERNVISLSRLQIILWTLLILSGFLTAALYNIFTGQSAPLRIAIQQELWWLMGISTTSLIASPLILNTKTNKTTNATEVGNTFALLEKQGDEAHTLSTKGSIVINTDLARARWSDIFTGEEVGNAAHLDVARLQMFIFTLIAVFAYAVALGKMFTGNLHQGITGLPELDSSLLALIAISHTGYLAVKAVPHSQTDSDSPPLQINATDDHPAVG
jgi:hypothetical protein